MNKILCSFVYVKPTGTLYTVSEYVMAEVLVSAQNSKTFYQELRRVIAAIWNKN